MIPKRTFPKDLKCLIDIVLFDRKQISFDEFSAAIIAAVLELNQGNRSHTALHLKIPIKTLRNKIKWIEGLGYEVSESAWGRKKKTE
jgi:transcriptional regulator with AAA-type ATPase domain